MYLGAMNRKHVQIVLPPGSGSIYFSYEGDFDVVLLALVDTYLKFLFVDVGMNG